MILYQEEMLTNGLTVIVHHVSTTPLVVVNLLYKVGSRNEHPDKTGFAHLFEHLMFGGSRHVPDFDKVLHRVGAENNAFTNTDITNYYIVLHASNIETAFWVESDRMQFLNLDQKSLDTQKNVVIEEFKQRYLNQPYGDVWLKLRPLAYTTHPYRWATIGMKTGHIEAATLDDVRDFHETFYAPGNAILTLCGNISMEKAMQLANKWLSDIPNSGRPIPAISAEPAQTNPRFMETMADVPMDALNMAFHMAGRGGKAYLVADLMSDILGRGKSSRLHSRLVKEKQVFNSIGAFITGSRDPGLVVISGKVNPGVGIHEAEKAVLEEITSLKATLAEEEVEKVVNQYESAHLFSETELMQKAQSLALFNSLGDTSMINHEIDLVRDITIRDVLQTADALLQPARCSTLHYKAAEKRH